MKKIINQKLNQSKEKPISSSMREKIEVRAYQIWTDGGGGHGSDVNHWLQAEAEILSEAEGSERSGKSIS